MMAKRPRTGLPGVEVLGRLKYVYEMMMLMTETVL